MNMNIRIFECNYTKWAQQKNLDKVILDYAHTSILNTVKEKAKNPKKFVDDMIIAYANLDECNDVHFICATNEQGELVGLCIYVMEYYEHALAREAHVDSIFLQEEYRKHGNGTAFMKFIFENAKKNGASLCFISANVGSKTNRVFGKMFKPMFNIFVKEL